MPDGQIDISRWEAGPDGFVAKANKQLDVIDRAIRESPTVPVQVRRDKGLPFILATVGEAAEISTNRWLYEMTEATVSGTDFLDKATPRTFEALNGMEAANSSSGLQGNGVNLDDDLFVDNPDLALRPIAEGAVVLCYTVPTPDGKVYVFFAPNGIEGDCA